jgi:hypothetical protein
MLKCLSFKTIFLGTVIVLVATGLMTMPAQAQSISGNVVDNTGEDFVQNGCVYVEAFTVDAGGRPDDWCGNWCDQATGDYSIGVYHDTWHVVVNIQCDNGYYGSTTGGSYEYIVGVTADVDYPGYDFEILEDPTPPSITDVTVATPTPRAGEDIEISATVADSESGVTWVQISARPVDAPEGWWAEHWGGMRMYDSGGGVYEGIIHGGLVHQAGVEYYIECYNYANRWMSDPWADPQGNPHLIEGTDIAPSEATISGNVTDNSVPANPMEWVEVYAYSTTGGGDDVWAWTDAGGDFTLEVQAGTWRIRSAEKHQYYVTSPERTYDNYYDNYYYEMTVNVGEGSGGNDFILTSDTTSPTTDHAPYYEPVFAGNELIIKVRAQDAESGVQHVRLSWRYQGQWGWPCDCWDMSKIEGDRFDGVWEVQFGVDYGRVVEYYFDCGHDEAGNGIINPDPPPPDDPYEPGSEPYRTILIKGSDLSMVFFGGAAYCDATGVYVGDIVTAQDTSGNIVGAHIVDDEGQYGFMAVYGNDPDTDDDEGLEPGEEISFFINGVRAQHDQVFFSAGTQPVDSVALNLTGFPLEVLEIPLNRGWNLFSLAVVPLDPSIESVLSYIWDDFEVVRGFDCSGAKTYVPGAGGLNDLTEMSEKSGYWIYMQDDRILKIEGVPYKGGNSCDAMADTEIDICDGWSLISYLAETSLSPDAALAPIIPYCSGDPWMLVRGYDRGAQTYSFDPDLSTFNNLDEMERNFGYWVRSCVGGTFDYPTGDTEGFTVSSPAPPLVLDNAIPTPYNVDFYGNLTIDGKPAPAGTVVKAFDPDGVLCGRFTVRSAGIFGFAHVYGDDEFTPRRDEGARGGDVITFYANGKLAETDELPIWTTDGARVKLNLTVKTSRRPVVRIAILYQNFPNPFNPDTWIPYQLSEGADVTIRIHNANGQLMRTLCLGKKAAGVYLDRGSAAYWDGKNEAGESVASGVYFYSIDAGTFSATKKLVILK